LQRDATRKLAELRSMHRAKKTKGKKS
jgi:hypothetical protein